MKNHIIVGVTAPYSNGTRFIFPHRPCDQKAIKAEFGKGFLETYDVIHECDGTKYKCKGLEFTPENVLYLMDYFNVEFQGNG